MDEGNEVSRRVGAAVVLAGSLLLASPDTVHAAEVYVVVPGSTRVRLHLGRAGLLKFLGHDHEIEVPVSRGAVRVDGTTPGRSSVELRFDSRALAVEPGSEPAEDIPRVEARMRGPEVLDAGRYPEILFTSNEVTVGPVGPGGSRVRIRGVLAIKERQVPVEVYAEVRAVEGTLVTTGAVDLNLRDLGIEPPTVAGVVKVANRARLTFEVRAHLQGPPASARAMPGASAVGRP